MKQISLSLHRKWCATQQSLAPRLYVDKHFLPLFFSISSCLRFLLVLGQLGTLIGARWGIREADEHVKKIIDSGQYSKQLLRVGALRQFTLKSRLIYGGQHSLAWAGFFTGFVVVYEVLRITTASRLEEQLAAPDDDDLKDLHRILYTWRRPISTGTASLLTSSIFGLLFFSRRLGLSSVLSVLPVAGIGGFALGLGEQLLAEHVTNPLESYLEELRPQRVDEGEQAPPTETIASPAPNEIQS